MKLRDYQNEALDALWFALFHSQTALCALPTGVGKSIIMNGFLRRCLLEKPDLRAIVLFNRVDLLEQLSERIGNYIGQENVGVFCGSLNERVSGKKVTVASIQSIFKFDFGLAHLCIVDECHNIGTEKDSQYLKFLQNQKQINDKFKILGFTATPYRATGRIYGMEEDKLFKSITYKKPMNYFIKRGDLVPPRLKKTPHQVNISGLAVLAGEYKQDQVDKLVNKGTLIFAQISDALPKLQGRKKIIWFCASIAHARNVTKQLRECGEAVSILHSKQKPEERYENKKAFIDERSQADFFGNGAKSNRHLVFISIVSEGFDYPPIDAIVILRPTRSPVRYVQVIGRGLRPFPGKEDCLVLDYGRVVENLGPVDNPVIPNKGERKESVTEKASMKFCPNCFEYIKSALMVCPDCKYEFPKPKPDLTKTSESRRGILKGDRQVEKLREIRFNPHDSKSGNKCLKIDYIFENLTQRTISEYFTFANEWGLRKAYRRCEQLGVKWDNDLSELINHEPDFIPETVTFTYEGRWPRVILFDAKRKSNPKRNPGLAQPSTGSVCLARENPSELQRESESVAKNGTVYAERDLGYNWSDSTKGEDFFNGG